MKKVEYNLSVPVRGASICYDDCGQGEVPILFIHGFPFNKSSWAAQIEYLKKQHRVIAYDIRGFGNSSSGDQEFSIALLADDLIQFMHQLDLSKAIVCGISMGGYILMNAVCRYPEKFKAIILCDTQCIADTAAVKDKRTEAIRQIEQGNLDDFSNQFLDKLFSPKNLELTQASRLAVKHSMVTTAPETVISALTALKNRDAICTSLHRISIPTLIVCGSDDVVTPPQQSEFIHQKIVGSELYMIDKAGHLPNIEQSGAFNEAIDQFVSQLIGIPV